MVMLATVVRKLKRWHSMFKTLFPLINGLLRPGFVLNIFGRIMTTMIVQNVAAQMKWTLSAAVLGVNMYGMMK